MKKIVALTIVLVLLLGVFTFDASAQETANVILNGTKLNFDVPAQIVNGRTLVPFRAIFEYLGFEVYWDDDLQVATGVRVDENLMVGFQIGYPAVFTAPYNAVESIQEKTIDVPAQLINGRTLIPLRALSDSIGANIKWDDNTWTAIIDYDSDIKLDDVNNIEKYLNKKYSSVTIGEKNYPVKFSVSRNYLNDFQWDIRIEPTIGLSNEVIMPLTIELTTVSREEKQTIVDSLKAFFEKLGTDIIDHFPNYKILGCIDKSFYKYPAIKEDYVRQIYFSWSNFDYDILADNDELKATNEFRWLYSEHDSVGRLDYNNYFDEVEVNTPVTIENDFDKFVVKDFAYKDSRITNEEGTVVYVEYEATTNGNGFAYINYYDKNGVLLDKEYNYFYQGKEKYSGSWPIGTTNIVISAKADMFEKNENTEITANTPFEIPAQYFFEDDFIINDCYFVKMEESIGGAFKGCYDYTFNIDATGSEYVYANFFDDDGVFLGSAFERIYDGESEYTFKYIPKGASHIEFGEEEIVRIDT